MKYGQGNEESVITEYLDSHLENGIKQKNLDKVLDLIDEYIELKEQRPTLRTVFWRGVLRVSILRPSS